MTTLHAHHATSRLDDFFARLHRAPRRLLLLDYDGTLAPFHDDPSRAKPYPGVRERLDRIMQDARTRVVVVSGRWTRDLVPLLRLRRSAEIWGSHGRERLLPDGEYRLMPIDETVLKALVEIDGWSSAIEKLSGRCERKPASLAVHWRGLSAAQIASVRQLLFDHWMEHGMAQRLEWHDFDGGVEMRAPGNNKGNTVDTLLKEEPGAVCAYLGDDKTDEDAFARLRGRGLTVLMRPDFRPTAAELWLRPPRELLDFLDRWHGGAAEDV